ncbi:MULTISPECIES: lipid A deacylase LpxR family protein [unclassified Polaromonas]|uniref:lipid A deacylase LpxR family protein n=2 Tax=unclassified Polaromonas TaxID=2638319 RepID=UPI0025E286DA|nr:MULTISPECIES: lipid A deacylase LpxR family protein [unclassified Polaromonas]HQR97054.1 lipid A deacylase LpxR family protein [Polaromonas sp.]HQT06238.1 lipid A deacylase LpxR family protein [Polaromonas sp.]
MKASVTPADSSRRRRCVSHEFAANFPPLTMPLPPRHGRGKAALILTLFLHMAPAIAQAANEDISRIKGCKADEVLRFRGLTARLENDLFADTDQNYTNGVALTAVSHDIAGKLRTECLPTPVRLHAELIKFVNPGFWSDAEDSVHTQNVVVKFGQSMFTPKDFARTDLILDDRPYAGLLYVGMSWNRRKHEPQSNLEILDTREITLGVIGPLSLAEQSQNLVHDVIGADKFLGWQHQLKNEPAMQMAMDRKFKDYRGTGAIQPGFSADSIRSLGLRLGNIETSAALGIEGRIGWNLPNDFGTYPIRPGAENRPPSAASIHSGSNHAYPTVAKPRPGIHLFGTLETKLVAHDFSLDGNLFRSSHSVTRRPWVAQAAVGISVHGLVVGHGVKLAVMRVYRSREFEEQRTNQAYGSVALSIEF